MILFVCRKHLKDLSDVYIFRREKTMILFVCRKHLYLRMYVMDGKKRVGWENDF